MMIQLVVSRHGAVLARVVLRGAARIGRSDACAIQIDDPVFSREHAAIEPHAGGWILRDLGSTNGLLKDGKRFAERTINDGDEVTISDYALTFTLDQDEDEAPLELPAALAQATTGALDLTFRTGAAGGADEADRERSSNLRAHLLEEGGGCWSVERDAFVIGRDAEADLRTSGLLAPRVGAVIVRGYGGFSVVNMSGRDGWLRVDGRPVPHAASLEGPARLEVGGRGLWFAPGAPPAGFEPAPQRTRARRPGV